MQTGGFRPKVFYVSETRKCRKVFGKRLSSAKFSNERYFEFPTIPIHQTLESGEVGFVANSVNDDDFIKLSSLPGRGTLCGYEYKSYTAADRTLLLATLEVLSIYYTSWLSKASDLRLICPGRPQLQKEDLSVDFSSSGTHYPLLNLLHSRGSRPASQPRLLC